MCGCQAAKGELVMNANNSGKCVQRTYNASQVAEILGVSLRTVYNLCETTKDFKVIHMGKRCLRIHKESFDRWFDSEYGALP
jgi:predicted DNA-binding transcriptional regulator AlpA